MSALDVIAHAKQKGLTLALDGEQIRVRGRMADPEVQALVDAIRLHKDEVIEVLKSREMAADIAEGRIVAVKIRSEVLQADIWLAFDESFKPGGGLAVFYAHELSLLKGKTPEQLREIHKVKLAFGPRSTVKK